MAAQQRLGFWQVWNMSFGFLGIQFGWGLQMANMSYIYESLGAEPHQIPMLWLAAPLTGLIVQPIIGHMSDRTWGWLGRRRPYFLVGAILSSCALILMPNSSTMWMAAGLLWILDASINISMEPFRAFVADILPEDQRTRGFAMQSVMIGLGAVIASALPWLLINVGGMQQEASAGNSIPQIVKLSFYIGAIAFMGAVLLTIFTTKEHPPEDIEAFRKRKAESAGIIKSLKEIFASIAAMPRTMKQLAWVQIFTWLGLFCMWLYFSVAVAHNIFMQADPGTPLYNELHLADGSWNVDSPRYNELKLNGVAWGGICFAMYSAVCFVVGFFLPALANAVGRKAAHSICLLCGAAGLLSVAVIHNQYILLLSMTGVGIAWASILSIPYAILSGSLPPKKIGIYMGIFNFFIVLPEIVAALGFGMVMEHLLNNNRMAAVVCGGVSMVIAAAMMVLVDDPGEKVPEVEIS